MRFPTTWVHALALAILLLAGCSALVYLAQGGFGGGHGRFDGLLLILGLPWSLIPWRSGLAGADFVWLILLPLALNAALLATILLACRRSRARD
jgi:hypothetical protein